MLVFKKSFGMDVFKNLRVLVGGLTVFKGISAISALEIFHYLRAYDFSPFSVLIIKFQLKEFKKLLWPNKQNIRFNASTGFRARRE